jgi:hypothetical protein
VSSRDEKTEYSLRDIQNLDTVELASKIFTFEKKIASKDITKMVDHTSYDIVKVIKNLQSMKDIDEEYVPKFKFFQIKKSKIKDISSSKSDTKTMICFIDIS